MSWWKSKIRRTSVVSVTPAMALLALIEANVQNRPIREVRVAMFSDRMCRGLWVLIASGISFSPTKLINGQHRLMAIVASGVTVQLTVTVGCDEAERAWEDEVAPRTYADRRGLSGSQPEKPRLAIMRGAISGLTGQSCSIGDDETFEELKAILGPGLEWAEGNAVRFVGGAGSGTVATAAIVAAWRLSPVVAAQFGADLASGTNLETGSPALWLRDYVAATKGKLRIRAMERGGQSERQAFARIVMVCLRDAVLGRPRRRMPQPREMEAARLAAKSTYSESEYSAFTSSAKGGGALNLAAARDAIDRARKITSG